ncbi:MAG: hypothetical protein BWY76_01807 [bacterium ADurb.Bin429]|nr:MAG: hypothetical protein BWY76_01807 [bacterium ADurb.Bin429]
MELPATMSTTIVSPSARPIPSIAAATSPDPAAGRMAWRMVESRLAPSASEPSRYVRGTAVMASSAMEMMVGSIISASSSTAVSAHRPVVRRKVSRTQLLSSAYPMKPMTTEGMAASSSTVGFMISRTARGASSAR